MAPFRYSLPKHMTDTLEKPDLHIETNEALAEAIAEIRKRVDAMSEPSSPPTEPAEDSLHRPLRHLGIGADQLGRSRSPNATLRGTPPWSQCRPDPTDAGA